MLSWLNLTRVRWRLTPDLPWRAGTEATGWIEVRNEKRVIPTYGVSFELAVPGERHRLRVDLSGRLDPGSQVQLPWMFRPATRGRIPVRIEGVSSLYPFGFVRKMLSTDAYLEAIVWPAPIAYEKLTTLTSARPLGGEAVSRAGQSGDLLAVRRYTTGDSHRSIHWKATARLRKLMVRQFATETDQAYALWLQTSADLWDQPERFERLCSFATSLSEDLFRAGQLAWIAIDDAPARPIRRLHELEEFFDQVAVLAPTPEPARAAPGTTRFRSSSPVISFRPDGPHAVSAYIYGTKAATA